MLYKSAQKNIGKYLSQTIFYKTILVKFYERQRTYHRTKSRTHYNKNSNVQKLWNTGIKPFCFFCFGVY